MATPEQLSDAEWELLKAETEVARGAVYRAVSELAVSILNDKHGPTGRNVEAAVAEAVAVYRGVVAALRAPA